MSVSIEHERDSTRGMTMARNLSFRVWRLHGSYVYSRRDGRRSLHLWLEGD